MVPVRFSTSRSLLSLLLVMLFDCTSGADTTFQWCILHALNDCCAKFVNLMWVIRSKGSSNGWPIVHPALQLKLPDHLVSVWLGTTLGDLVSTNVGFVQVMHEIDSKLNQKVALRLVVVWIVQPVIKILLSTEPKHCVRTILNPVGLLPLLGKNGSKRDARQNPPTLLDQFSLWQR